MEENVFGSNYRNIYFSFHSLRLLWMRARRLMLLPGVPAATSSRPAPAAPASGRAELRCPRGAAPRSRPVPECGRCRRGGPEGGGGSGGSPRSTKAPAGRTMFSCHSPKRRRAPSERALPSPGLGFRAPSPPLSAQDCRPPRQSRLRPRRTPTRPEVKQRGAIPVPAGGPVTYRPRGSADPRRTTSGW